MPGLWPAAFVLTALVTEPVFNEPPRHRKTAESLCVQQAPPAAESRGCSARRSRSPSRRGYSTHVSCSGSSVLCTGQGCSEEWQELDAKAEEEGKIQDVEQNGGDSL